MLCLLTYVLELFYSRAVRYQGAGRTRASGLNLRPELCTCSLGADAKKTSTVNKPNSSFINENPHQPQAETTVTLTSGLLLIGRLDCPSF